ncbi:MAG: DUF4340 domain-containing protein, partial [Myxococcota bacterium]|nr:DUF4340 domain-containing protein [Myxococcota bacterium]
ESGWILASHGGYPADSGKVGTLLDSLLGIRVSAPVTTSPTSHSQLQVAADTHDKRVRIGAGQTVELLVGAGGKDAHVRRADQDEVHVARGLSPWSLGTTPSQYHDPIYLSLDADSVASVELHCSGDESAPLQLERSGDAWASPALEAEQSLDADSVDALVGKLASLRIAALPEDPAVTPQAVCTVSWVTVEEGASVVGSLVIGAEEQGRRRVIVEGNPHSVMVSSYGLEPLVTARLEELLASGDDTGAPMLLPVP